MGSVFPFSISSEVPEILPPRTEAPQPELDVSRQKKSSVTGKVAPGRLVLVLAVTKALVITPPETSNDWLTLIQSRMSFPFSAVPGRPPVEVRRIPVACWLFVLSNRPKIWPVTVPAKFPEVFVKEKSKFNGAAMAAVAPIDKALARMAPLARNLCFWPVSLRGIDAPWVTSGTTGYDSQAAC